MGQVISGAIKNITEEHDCPGVTEAATMFMPSPQDCLHTLRIKIMVLIDQDEGTRRRLCQFTSSKVSNYRPVDPKKADRFYSDLHYNLIPDWIKNETVSSSDFVDKARMSYLIS